LKRKLANLEPGRVEAGGALEVEGVLYAEGRGDLTAARLELAAIREDSGEIVDVPLTIERAAGFSFAATVRLAEVLPESGAARLRLRLTWRNSAWQTDIAVPAEDGEVALSFGPGGVVQLAR
jgi:hypothetical protein